MPYRIRYSTSAKEEANHLASYGVDFQQEFGDWLKHLAEEAEVKKYNASVDAWEFFESLMSAESSPCKEVMTQSTWEMFKGLPFVGKAKALIVLIKKRCPPWQFRAATNWITALGMFEMEVALYYMVDHVEKQIVIYLIDFDRVQK